VRQLGLLRHRHAVKGEVTFGFFSNLLVIPKTNGFYFIENDSLQRKGRDFLRGYETFVLYDNGYFVAVDMPSAWKSYKRDVLRAKEPLHWGRYQVENDSITIQYFSKTSTPGGFILPRFEYTVHEGTGKVPNDSTIIIFEMLFKNAGNFLGYGPGRHNVKFNPPLVFKFVPCTELPSSENWLMIERLKK
jgi:hypothetical protein